MVDEILAVLCHVAHYRRGWLIRYLNLHMEPLAEKADHDTAFRRTTSMHRQTKPRSILECGIRNSCDAPEIVGEFNG